MLQKSEIYPFFITNPFKLMLHRQGLTRVLVTDTNEFVACYLKSNVAIIY